MSIENEQTIKVYEKKANHYIKTGIIHDNLNPIKAEKKKIELENRIKEYFKDISTGGNILEIGSANGENAKYLKGLGYEVTGSDIADDFIQATKDQGINTIKYNVLRDKLDSKYDGVFCWRVFVHFTLDDLEVALKNIYELLEDNGILMFNVMNREVRNVDNEWVDFSNEYHMGEKRFYNYFRENDINNIVNNIGYTIDKIEKEGRDENNKWIIYKLVK